MAMKNKVREFVSRVEPAMLSGLLGVQEHIGALVPPERIRVQMPCLFRETEHSHTVRLQHVYHVGDRPHSDTPMRTQRCCCLARRTAVKLREIMGREIEPLLNPVVQL